MSLSRGSYRPFCFATVVRPKTVSVCVKFGYGGILWIFFFFFLFVIKGCCHSWCIFGALLFCLCAWWECAGWGMLGSGSVWSVVQMGFWCGKGFLFLLCSVTFDASYDKAVSILHQFWWHGIGFLVCCHWGFMSFLMHLWPFSAYLHNENVRVGVEVGLS